MYKIIENAIESYKDIIVQDITRAVNEGKYYFNFSSDYILGNAYCDGIFKSAERELKYFDTSVVREKQITALKNFFAEHGYRCNCDLYLWEKDTSQEYERNGLTIYW